MLSQWIQRVGSIVAPDPKFSPKSSDDGNSSALDSALSNDVDDGPSPFWSIIAPDPQYEQQVRRSRSGSAEDVRLSPSAAAAADAAQAVASGQAPQPSAFSTPDQHQQHREGGGMVECWHCHRQTPGTGGSMVRSGESDDAFSLQQQQHMSGLDDAEFGVAHASRATLEVIRSPVLQNKRKQFDKFFRILGEHTFYNDSKHATLEKMLTKDRPRLCLLFDARATGEEAKGCPYGYTPLMVVAKNGNTKAFDLMIQFLDEAKQPVRVLEYLHERNLDGHTVLHVASENCQMDILGHLLAFEKKLNASLDELESPPGHIAVATRSTPLQERQRGQNPSVRGSSSKKLSHRKNNNNHHYHHQGNSNKSPFRSPPLQQTVDIMGRTPLGLGLSSPTLSRQRQTQLMNELYHNPATTASEMGKLPYKDISIYGEPIPHNERSYKSSMLRLVAGTADMPGVRVDMEDSILVHVPVDEETNQSNSFALLGVFDGHGDGGCCSEMAAMCVQEELLSRQVGGQPLALTPTTFREVFLAVDDRIRQEGIPGGSTGVVALVSSVTSSRPQIIVANLGDSRCILVSLSEPGRKQPPSKQQQHGESSGEEGSQAKDNDDAAVIAKKMENLELKDDADAKTKETESVASAEQATPKQPFVVKPLSHDHKPGDYSEKFRIEDAGVEVVEVKTTQANGKEVILHKLVQQRSKLGDKVQLAVSRSFGDFEWKGNDQLPVDQQAVIAVPDVVAHERADSDAFLILACDGIWDVMTNEEVGQFVYEKVMKCLEDHDQDYILSFVADQLLQECFDRHTQDNMSVVIAAVGSMADRISARLPQRLDSVFGMASSY